MNKHLRATAWAVHEDVLNVHHLAQVESVMALSNGHIGLRANLEEGEPAGLPGTYLNAFYEVRPLPYAEAGYGYPEDGQTIVNVTDGKLIRLLVDDEPFDIRYGELLAHTRKLDLRTGLLHREVHWRSPAGRAIKLRTTRLVSFTHRAIAAIDYEVEACDEGETRIVVQSELVANEPLPDQSEDPRAAAALRAPLVAEDHDSYDMTAVLMHRTRESGLRVAAGMAHWVDGPEDTICRTDASDDLARATFNCALAQGETLRVTKLLAYGWSSQRTRAALRDQTEAALASAKRTGWDGLVADQRAYLDDFWTGADVEIEGDSGLQAATRFGIFHTLQAGARSEARAIPAKGLTGPGYDGHVFWDTEAYVLHMLSYTAPAAAADALAWRASTLDLAMERAKQLGLRGAAFPWRTIRGQECSAYWPAGTAAFHINADIAGAALRHVQATGDEPFAIATALPLLVQTARLWRSLGHHDPTGAFHIDGVTGPDEYSALADDNVFTNLMAERNLRGAADLATAHPDAARRLHVDEEEIAAWRDAAAAMHVPYDEDLGVHPQAEGFTRHRIWDFEATGEDDYPLFLHAPYFDIYRSQVVKQADLVAALFVRGDRFTPEEKARDFAYYEAICVRDSSLSACIQGVVAAEVGHLELAYDYFGEAARVDLDDLAHNTKDGLHIASLAGSWLVAVCGFGGLRDHEGELSFAPRLPPALTRLAFAIGWRGRRLRVDITPGKVRYELIGDGGALELRHEGETLRVSAGAPQERDWHAPDPGPAPRQPRGRAPHRRTPT